MAFASARYLDERKQQSDAPKEKLTTLAEFAKEASPLDWEDELRDMSLVELDMKAERVWRNSWFGTLIDGAMHALLLKAAPRCIDSALRFAQGSLVEIVNDEQLVMAAIGSGKGTILQQIDALQSDLRNLDEIRKQLDKALEETNKKLHEDLNRHIWNFRQQTLNQITSTYNRLFNEYKNPGQ